MIFRESDRQLLRSIFEQNTAILTKLAEMQSQQLGATIMADLAALETEIKTLTTALATSETTFATDLAAVSAKLDDLAAKVAAGAKPQDFTAQIAEIQASIDGFKPTAAAVDALAAKASSL